MNLRISLCLLLVLAPFTNIPAQASFGPLTNYNSLTSGPWRDVNWGFVNADCYPDLLVASDDIVSNFVAVFYGSSSGLQSSPVVIPISTGFTILAAAAADLDGDGDGDIVAFTGQNHYTITNGPGGFTLGPLVADAVAGISCEVKSIDIDFDLDMDIVFSKSGGPPLAGIQVLRNDGGGVLTSVWFANTPSCPDFELADFTNDGILDLASVHESINLVQVWPGISHGVFGVPSTYLQFFEVAFDLETYDFNGDGGIDIFVNGGFIHYLLYNQSNGASFGALSVGHGPGGPFTLRMQLGNFDLDADPELIVATTGNSVQYWEYSTTTFSPLGFNCFAHLLPRVVDVDLNGLPDAVGSVASIQLRRNITANLLIAPGRVLTSVNGGPVDASPKMIDDGDSFLIRTDVLLEPCLEGRPAALFMNLPPDSASTGITPIGPSTVFPAFSLLWPFSQPQGLVYVCGNALYAITGLANVVDFGLPPLFMGDPALTGVLPAGSLMPGDKVRLQAIYYDPRPGSIVTFGLVATNVAEFQKM